MNPLLWVLEAPSTQTAGAREEVAAAAAMVAPTSLHSTLCSDNRLYAVHSTPAPEGIKHKSTLTVQTLKAGWQCQGSGHFKHMYVCCFFSMRQTKTNGGCSEVASAPPYNQPGSSENSLRALSELAPHPTPRGWPSLQSYCYLTRTACSTHSAAWIQFELRQQSQSPESGMERLYGLV